MRKLLVAVLMLAASPALAEDNLKPSAIDASVRSSFAAFSALITDWSGKVRPLVDHFALTGAVRQPSRAPAG